MHAELDFTHSQIQHLPGFGLLCGFEISVKGSDSDPAVDVAPGYALDARGRKILLHKPLALSLPTALERASVIARLTQRHATSIAVLPSGECEFLVVAEPKDGDLLLGRLERAPHGWRLMNRMHC